MKRQVYRLTPLQNPDEALALRLDVETGGKVDPVFLLNYPDANVLLIQRNADEVHLKDADFKIENLGILKSLVCRLTSWLPKKRAKYLKFPRYTLIAGGSRSARKSFERINRTMMRVGLPLDGQVSKHPELLAGWASRYAGVVPSEVPQPTQIRLAIVVHIYYEETWPEIEKILLSIRHKFTPIFTTTYGRASLIERIHASFPDAKIRVVENSGRDVRPFLVLLEEGELDGFDYICKIHGKKSQESERSKLMGNLWRRRLFFDLLMGPHAIANIIDCFEKRRSVGIIGSRTFRYPNNAHPEPVCWGENSARLYDLMARLRIPPESFHLDYFSGTMFWVRREALTSLRKLGLSAEFEPEAGKLDGAMEHALERFFSPSIVAAGYDVADIDGFDAIVEVARPRVVGPPK